MCDPKIGLEGIGTRVAGVIAATSQMPLSLMTWIEDTQSYGKWYRWRTG